MAKPVSNAKTVPSVGFAQVESAVNGDKNDHRVLLQYLLEQVSNLNQVNGQAQTNPKSVATPAQGSIDVDGSNGALNYSITSGESDNPATIYHQVSYSPTKSFTDNVKTLPWSTATSGVINAPGKKVYVRLTSSFNKVVKNQPVLHGQSPVDAGLISSAAIAEGTTYAQSNLGTVTSTQSGGTAAIIVQGAGGTLTSMTRLKGGVQSLLPPATFFGATLGSNQYVGYDGKHYVAKPTLGAVLDDSLIPVGKVTVASGGNPGTPGGGGTDGGNGGRLSNV